MAKREEIDTLPFVTVEFSIELNVNGDIINLPRPDSIITFDEYKLTISGKDMTREIWQKLIYLPEVLQNTKIIVKCFEREVEKYIFQIDVTRLEGYWQDHGFIVYRHNIGFATLVDPTPEQKAKNEWKLKCYMQFDAAKHQEDILRQHKGRT